MILEIEVLEFKVVEAVLVANNLDYIDILLIDKELSNSLLIEIIAELKDRITNLIAERFIV